jgi:EAL domain-containing protein (putative c-di-GMP-specific phosphodiesterase class I)
VERAITDAGLRPADIDIELTETAFLLDQVQMTESLEGLSRLGVGLILDDFGTGYSGLSYLSRLPLTGLKIDRSFVRLMARSERDAAVVRASVAFAKALELPVVAEGVETDNQLARLTEMGCDSAQGYLFARPLGRDSIDGLLADEAEYLPAASASSEVATPAA